LERREGGEGGSSKKRSKKNRKKVRKKVRKIFMKNYKLLEGGWRIVIPIPEALNYVERPQAKTKNNLVDYSASQLTSGVHLFLHQLTG
jgi:hypothetical protein